jgi:CBS domain-containing protein
MFSVMVGDVMRKHEPVNRLMTEAVLSIDANEPAGEVLRLFREYPVHHLPVVEDRRVVGVLSAADLLKLRAMIPRGVASAEKYLNEKLKVQALIARPAITIAQHETIERASALMATHNIHSLPVVDSKGHLVGILTTTDIIAAMFDPAPARADVRCEASHSTRITREQFLRAVAHATQAVEQGQDPDGLAAALLYAQHRIALLEGVMAIAARYLGAGQDVHLHRELGKAIEQARGAQLSEDPETRALGFGAA